MMNNLLGDRRLSMSNTSDAVAELIRTAILEGRLASGLRLKEQELAAELGTSRTPVREALQRLQSDGLVDIIPKRGAVVKTHNATELADLYDVRALLEGYAAERAAERATDEQIKTLQSSCERFERHIDTMDIRALERENLVFHYAVADSSNTIKIADFIRASIEVPLTFRTFSNHSADDLRKSLAAHRDVTAMIASRDHARAGLIMKNHIYEGRDRLTKYLRTLDESDGADVPSAIAASASS